jgi:DNA replication and repair protein RecF
VFIEKIKIKNFRNIQSVHAQFCPNVNIFFGENAQGKTNLLEAIYTALHGESFRTTQFENLLSMTHQNEPASTELTIIKKKLSFKLNSLLSKTEKKTFLNEKKVTKSTIRREFSTILFSPESLSVIKNSDRERRDLVDDLVESVYFEQSKILVEYRKLLRQRNSLLKDFKENKYEINPKNILYLETLTEKFLNCGAALVTIRVEALQKIIPRLEQVLRGVFNQNDVDIAVDYMISDIAYREINLETAHDAMYKRWLLLKSAEIKTGHSLVGPHKHDICLLFNGKDSRHYCSQGQQRLLILAFKMAQIGLHFDVHGTYPILLLDDVLSEIDEQKRHKLIETLESLRAQIFITTTENTVLRYMNRGEYFVFEVKKGQLSSKTGYQEELSV